MRRGILALCHAAVVQAEDAGDYSVQRSWDADAAFAAPELALVSALVGAECDLERRIKLLEPCPERACSW